MDYAKFIDEQIADIKKTVGQATAINALSGGVDSSVVTVLGHRALGDRLKTVFIENALMREGEAQRVAIVAVPPARMLPALRDIIDAKGGRVHLSGDTRRLAAEMALLAGGLAEGKKLAHSGVDIAAPRNTPVLATAPGRVVWVGYGLSTGQYDPDDPYGLAVAIDHDFGFGGYRLSTVSAHLDRIDVSIGQRVESGTQLGVVGTTGNTTGPHLHFEIWHNGKPVDPETLLIINK